MAKFVALTSKGLGEVVKSEALSLGLKVSKANNNQVLFESNWKDCYRAHLGMRSATRILLPVLDFIAYKNEELYLNTLKHDFTKYITLDQTLAIKCKVTNSHFTDNRFVALKIKDAIVDQFREKFGERPNIDVENPDLLIHVKVKKADVSIAIDLSGQSLSKRGYRLEATEAPMREHLAAGLVTLMDWDKKTSLIDPMCGSGTLLIEAAMQLKNSFSRRHFGFQNFINYTAQDFKNARESFGPVKDGPFPKLYGFDKSKAAIDVAIKNAKSAGVDKLIEFSTQPLNSLEPTGESGIIITNPPYGQRLEDEESLKVLFADFSSILKTKFKKWDCYILSGNPELTKAFNLKASKKYDIANGQIACKFLKYSIF